MKYAAPTLTGVLIFFIVFGGFQNLKVTFDYMFGKHFKTQVEYHETGAIPVHKESKCISTSQQLDYWEVELRILEETDDFAGRWTPSKKLIELHEPSGTDVDTIAHEVFHMVEDVMVWNNVGDPHIGAYLQGNWTECILALMLKQQRTYIYAGEDPVEKQLPKFRFVQ